MIRKIKNYFSEKVKYQLLKTAPLALCYHDICSTTEKLTPHLHQVTQLNFHTQLTFLKSKGKTFLPAEEFLQEKFKNQNLNIATVTFDDGYLNVLKYGAPVLESLNIPYTLYLNSILLEKKMFWRDKIRHIINNNQVDSFMSFISEIDNKLFHVLKKYNFYYATKQNEVNSNQLDNYINAFFERNKISIADEKSNYINKNAFEPLKKNLVCLGNHTHQHFRLSSLNNDEQKTEILTCIQMLKKLNMPLSNTFAIPFGENSSFNQSTIGILSDLGFSGFFMTNQNQFGQNEKLNVKPLHLNYSNRVLPKNNAKII